MPKPERLVLLLLASATLGAADFTGGLQLGPALPLGDFKTVTDGSTGFQFSLFGLWDLDQGHAIRARFTSTGASGKPRNIPTSAGPAPLGGDYEVTLNASSLGADYLYFFNGNAKDGPYAGAGAALARNGISLTLGNFSGRDTNTAADFGLYTGYHFTPHWSAELAYHTSRFNKAAGAVNLDYALPSLALVGGYTF